MKRYEDITIGKRNTKRLQYNTIVYPTIPPSVSDTYIIGAFGDRLDNLAWEYYQDPSLWWIIARANKVGFGNMGGKIGEQLRIPFDIEGIKEEFNILNKPTTKRN